MKTPKPDYANLRLEELNYGSYLQLPALLELQTQVSNPPHHDEMFFIIIHQTAELWFKEVLHETELLVAALRRGSVSRAIHTIDRISEIFELLVKQIKLLSTLTPVEFAGFRDLLKPASGFQSFQFREVEFRFGVRDEFFLRFFEKKPQVAARLRDILHAPSVYDELLQALATAGFPVPEDLLTRDPAVRRSVSPELVECFRQIYEQPGDDYHWVLLLEALVNLDTKYLHWKDAHLVMVGRTIGHSRGTGGSAGYDFLRSRLELRFFPELWQVRDVITGKPAT